MKPLKLTMSAFSSYADEQTIDFTRLGSNGLYLITGETGSGKTTIFDAISFALFGEASGEDRDYKMLRSDFAAEKTRTYVELDFLSGEKQYKIKRVIKNSGQEAALTLPDGTPVTRNSEIKQKIAEIIGLDRGQFAQIIMIAQNDFLRFLKSKTDERMEILRRIFNTEILKNFNDRLKELALAHKNERDIIIQKFKHHDVDIYGRNEQFAEWESQIKTYKNELTQADIQLGLYDEQKQKLAADLVKAMNLNKDFTELDNFQRDFEEHQAKAKEIEMIKSRVIRGKTSLYKIKPFADDFQKAENNYAVAKTSLETAIKQQDSANNELVEAVKSTERLQPLDNAREAFNKLLKHFETEDEKLKRLAALKTNRNDITGKQVALTKMQEEWKTVVNILSVLPPIADCQAEFEKITEELKLNEDKQNKLSVLKKDIDAVEAKQKMLAEKQSKFRNLKVEFDDIDTQYRAMDEAFINNQAGIMAGYLTDGEPCPVCGSKDHPAPAKLSDTGINESKLKTAEETRDTLRLKLEEQSSECNKLLTEINMLEKIFLENLLKFIPDATIESAVTLLPKELNTVQLTVKNLTKKKKDAEEKLADVKIKSENAKKKQDELTPKIASGKGEIEALKERFVGDFCRIFPEADWENSEKLLFDLFNQTQKDLNKLIVNKNEAQKNLEKLIEDWDFANKKKADAGNAVTEAKTRVIERTSKLSESENIYKQAISAYKNALQGNSFTETEYKTSLITQNELTELEKQLLNYEKKSEQFTRDIERLKRETAGKERPDIEKLQAEQESLNHNSEVLKMNRDELYSKFNGTENKLKELRRVAAEFEKIEKSYSSIKELSDTANGKLKFETYAQIKYFEHIIHAANVRLNLMSKSRYIMQRKKDSDDGRKQMGLDIEVLDAYTGKVRSANSLSGGESFMASLSLALGLSDIVQQNAGGIRLDAMFIDEGFGSLDTEVLELAVRTISEMAGKNRIIGIISHITELREMIDKRIHVEKTMSGSRISLSVQ